MTRTARGSTSDTPKSSESSSSAGPLACTWITCSTNTTPFRAQKIEERIKRYDILMLARKSSSESHFCTVNVILFVNGLNLKPGKCIEHTGWCNAEPWPFSTHTDGTVEY